MTNVPCAILVEIKNDSREFSRADKSLAMVSELFQRFECRVTVRKAGRLGRERNQSSTSSIQIQLSSKTLRWGDRFNVVGVDGSNINASDGAE